MTDDRLMLVAQAAGYSMIPPQESCDDEPENGTSAMWARADEDRSSPSYLAKARRYLSSVSAGGHATAVRGAVTNWLQSRAHA
jgi:hypothetical protein